MSTPADMRASQVRTEDGYPCCEADGPITRPRASVHAPISGTLDQRTWHETDRSTGKRVNEALPWIATAMLIAGIAVALAISSMMTAARSERETRMLEFYILELDAKLIAAGYKTDAESIAKKLKQRGEK